MYLFIDESGYDNNYVFAAVKMQQLKTAEDCVSRWRRRAKSVSPKLQVNEYKDYLTPQRQRERILTDIAKNNIEFWALLFTNYRGHKWDYSKAIINLLKYCDLKNIEFIVLDKVEESSAHMQKHIRAINKGVDMNLNILGGDSEKEKGIQIADAVCGSLSRYHLNRLGPSYYHLISHLMIKPILKIK